MKINKLIERIKLQGYRWEIFYKIILIGLLAYIALSLSWIDRGFEKTRRNLSDIQSDVSSINSDISSIQSDVSMIKSDVSSMQLDISNIESNTSP